MAVYTDITDAELEAFLARFDLGEAVSFKGIAEGVENSNFLLETRAGRYILTVYERRVREADLPFFLGLMQWLNLKGYPSATPIADRRGHLLGRLRDKPAAIIAFLPGLSVRRPLPAHCREAGEGLAWLHLAAAGFGPARANDLGRRAWAGIFGRLNDEAEALKAGLAATISADLDRLAADWPADLPHGIIHGDWFADNVFFRGGVFAGAIDFYFAAQDVLAYDLGIALNAWCFEADGSFNVSSARALVSGYDRRRPLSAREKAALPILARGAAMRFFLTRLNDWGEARPGALVRPKDPLEFERKLAVHRQAARSGVGLRLFEAGE
ncbi:MAG: homoserine kinase [Caulobacteraceae bacterium]